MAPAHFKMLNNELLNKDTYVVPEQPPIITLDIKSAICMYNNGKDVDPRGIHSDYTRSHDLTD